jgi:hypothetical protein
MIDELGRAFGFIHDKSRTDRVRHMAVGGPGGAPTVRLSSESVHPVREVMPWATVLPAASVAVTEINGTRLRSSPRIGPLSCPGRGGTHDDLFSKEECFWL